MKMVNTIPLNSYITIFRDTGVIDMFGKPASYEKQELSAAVFDVKNNARVNYLQEVTYDTVIYTDEEILKSDKIFLGSTTETDPSKLKVYEIRKLVTMKDVFQAIQGYKIWL